jgi:hypothetical protein
MGEPASGGPSEVLAWIELGRTLFRERRYAEAGALFDRALARAPNDPSVQALAVTAEFWRRLAREGDGIPPMPSVKPARFGAPSA